MKQNKRNLKIIVNADDFGASQGTNKAIIQGSTSGIINSTSIMINIFNVDDEDKNFLSSTNIDLGLHLNLTNEYAVSNKEDIDLLVDKDGKFKNGFVKLFLLSLIHPIKFKKQVELETRAQIKKYKNLNIKLLHIDGHRHIHAIPSIFSIIKKLTKEYNIDRIRIINENIFYTTKYNKDYSFLFNGGFIKYCVLIFFSIINHYKTNTYFFSILYTGKIFEDKVLKIKVPKKYESLEIMVHPNIVGIDKENEVFDKNIVSNNRIKEMQMLMNKDLLEKINENNK